MARWLRHVVSVLCLTAAASSPALAQVQRCFDGARVYYSDRGCGSGSQDKLRQIGPAPAPNESRRSSYAVKPTTSVPPRAPAHLPYLVPECASISDAIRTAPSRGVGRDVVAELRREYDDKCREADQLARDQARKAQRAERDQRLAELKAGEIARIQSQREAEQCDGMRDVIQSRRARIGQLNELDLAAMRRLESTYNERCLRR